MKADSSLVTLHTPNSSRNGNTTTFGRQ